MTHDELRDWIADYNPDALLADGFEDAILGVAERCSQDALVVYDAEKCVEILMSRDHLSYEAAQEFFDFNVAGAWVGVHTPLFLTRRPEED